MKLMIIGCPRSGFRYISTVFRKAGLAIGHEVWGADGTANYTLTPRQMPDDAVILHQVRHPLDVIGSMKTINDRSWDILMRDTTARKKHGLIERGMRVYMEWNKLAALRSVLSYRVEDIDTIWSTLAVLVGLGDVSLPDVKRDLNSRKKLYQRPLWVDLQDRDLGLALEIATYYRTLGE